MNPHVHRFYRKSADGQAPVRVYEEVIGLHEAPHFTWEEISEKAPTLPRGWHELSCLNTADRIEFTRDYWLSALPFLPHVHDAIHSFFERLDDVGIYLTRIHPDAPFECEIVYSLKDGSSFYHGSPPCSHHAVQQIQSGFQNVLPEDYLAFLKIHDGFSKSQDTGMIRISSMNGIRQRLCEELEQIAEEISSFGYTIDPLDLFPFYESFGQMGYQCFFSGWTPMEQAGNVYCSSREKTLSDVRDRATWQQNLAFPSFLDWLVFYLERIG